MNLGQYLYELLLENETVIIPGFGAFISNYKPAEINEQSGKIVPPSKEIAFNGKIRNNDGLLVGYVAETESVSHFDALKMIEKERENIVYQLDKGEPITLENIGLFFRNEENEIDFEPQIQENLLLDSFGLESVSLEQEIEPEKVVVEPEEVHVSKEEPAEAEISEPDKVVEDETMVQVESIEEETTAESETEKETEEKTEKEIVALVPDEEKIPEEEQEEIQAKQEEIEVVEETQPEEEKTEEKEIAEPGLVPENQQKEETTKEEQITESDAVVKEKLVLEDKQGKKKKRGWLWFILIFIPIILAGLYLAKDKFFPDDSHEIVLQEEKENVSESQKSLEVTDSVMNDSIQNLPVEMVGQTTDENVSAETAEPGTSKFYLVGGSFKEQENVDKFIEQFDAEGYEPFLLGKRGNFFIVVIGTYSTEREAVIARDTFMEKNPGSGTWVFEDKPE